MDSGIQAQKEGGGRSKSKKRQEEEEEREGDLCVPGGYSQRGKRDKKQGGEVKPEEKEQGETGDGKRGNGGERGRTEGVAKSKKN